MKLFENRRPVCAKETKRMLFVTIGVFFIMVLLRPTLFLRPANFLSMGYQLPELGLFSLAMMFTMLSGGIDLSVVAIGNFACVIAAKILSHAESAGLAGAQLGIQIGLAVVLAICVGAVFGLINGVLIAWRGIPPMLLTMATSIMITGASIVITGGKTVSGISACLLYFGNHTLIGIPYSLWLFAVIAGISAFILNRHTFGFKLRMVGSNPQASRYTGIDTRKILLKVYLLSGLLSSVCGLEILLKTNTAKADYAGSYVLQAILCAVLGATNPDGGFAKISCLLLSLISLQFLSSGFNLLRLGGYYKDFSWGLLLLLVLSIDYFVSLRQNAPRNRKTETQE